MKRTLSLAAGALLLASSPHMGHAQSMPDPSGAPADTTHHSPSAETDVPFRSQPPLQAQPPAKAPAQPTANIECKPVPACSVARVNFGLDSTELDDTSKEALDRTVSCLEANPDLQIIVEGATDDTGSDDYNLDLGQRRAMSVADYLESKGLSAQKVATLSTGANDPLCNQDNEDCRSLNRRASITPSTHANVAQAVRRMQ